MPKPTVLLTYPMNSEIERLVLAPKCRVLLAPNLKTFQKYLPSADAAIVLCTETVDRTLLKHAKKLKVLGNFGVGVNNIDLAACKSKRIRVVNTPGVLTQSTAEVALALTLAAAKNFQLANQICTKRKPWKWAPNFMLGHELFQKHAVVAGKGRIGQATAKLFKALKMRVTFILKTDSDIQIDKKLSKADVLSIHLPLTPKTKHWLSAKRIRALPKHAIVINTARGPIIDEKALIKALKEKRISAAGLYVYENEPLIPKALARLENVYLLPHLGSATYKARREMARLVCEGVVAVLSGKRPFNQVI